MKPDSTILAYLRGEKFSNGTSIHIYSRKEVFKEKFQLIEEIVCNKKIIHIGCCDHLPLIDLKMRHHTWLHARLCEWCQKCIGIDINRNGIDYLKNSKGYDDVFCADITNTPEKFILEENWDYFVLGDILEHVDNPCDFLKKICENYSQCVDILLISVPNALSGFNIFYALFNREYVNTDHRYNFTIYSLSKIVYQAGMTVDRYWFCQSKPNYQITLGQKILKNSFYLQKIFFRLFPTLQHSLIMIVKVKEDK